MSSISDLKRPTAPKIYGTVEHNDAKDRKRKWNYDAQYLGIITVEPGSDKKRSQSQHSDNVSSTSWLNLNVNSEKKNYHQNCILIYVCISD